MPIPMRIRRPSQNGRPGSIGEVEVARSVTSWSNEAMRPSPTHALLLCALLLAGGFAAGCDNGPAGATAPSARDEPKPVRLAQAVSGTLPVTVTATGTLAAEDQVVLNTKVAGRLREL